MSIEPETYLTQKGWILYPGMTLIGAKLERGAGHSLLGVLVGGKRKKEKPKEKKKEQQNTYQ